MEDVVEKRRFLGTILSRSEEAKKNRVVGAPKTGLTTLSRYFPISESHIQKTENKSNAVSERDYEIFPLTLAEVCSVKNNPLRFPLLDRLLYSQHFENILETIPAKLSDEEKKLRKSAQEYLLTFGGLPGLLHISEERRYEWLTLYKNTHIKNTIAHLTQSAKLLNYSEIAREANISVDSARRYIDQLIQDYQIILLQPYHRNLTSRVVKTPKLYWLDVGIWRVVSSIYGPPDKSIYETFVVAEIIKWLRTMKRNVNYYFYRTRSGREIDLVLELPQGVVGIEIQSRSSVVPKDITPMKELAKILGSEWLGGLVVYNSNERSELHEIKKMAEPNIWALPSWRLLT